MSRSIIFSRFFPAYHPRKGEPTQFVEKIWKSLIDTELQKELWFPYISEYIKVTGSKLPEYDLIQPKFHTIRAGNRWKVGDKFSPRVWSGKPYNSKQIIIAPDIEIKKVWNFEIKDSEVNINGFLYNGKTKDLIKNDGLEEMDFWNWFQFPKPFSGQIICWNENINY